MARKLKKLFSIEIKISGDFKEILERRALFNKHPLEKEILSILEKGLTENEKIQLDANLYLNSFLKSNEQKRKRNEKRVIIKNNL